MQIIHDDTMPGGLRRIVVIIDGDEAAIRAALEEFSSKDDKDHPNIMINVYPTIEAIDYNGWSCKATWRAGRGWLTDFDNDANLRRSLHDTLQ